VPSENCGAIVFGFRAAVDCLIVNTSELGACVEVTPSTDPTDIPGEFTLLLDAPRAKRRCRVVWRSFQRIGVQFT
jgi:hypothetical protein